MVPLKTFRRSAVVHYRLLQYLQALLIVPSPRYSSSQSPDSDYLSNNNHSTVQHVPTPHGHFVEHLETVLSCLRSFHSDAAESKRRLETSGAVPTTELVDAALDRLRHDWAPAYTFFIWAASTAGVVPTAHAHHTMLSILARHRRFDTAWALIADMRRSSPDLFSRRTILILIRRYCAVHDIAKAISTFHSYKRFGFTPCAEDFHDLLSALCRYKNVEDAEHLLMRNDHAYPLETKSFNIVLNGWCNVLVRVGNAKRFWADMDHRGIPKDAVSYGCMISLFSKAGNINDVLKLFNRMKDSGIEPDRMVYNAVVYALAKGGCLDDAKKLVKTMEEKGVTPNAVTINSLIRPICKSRKSDEAWLLLDEMWKRGLLPSIRTFHSLFDVSRTSDEVFELLGRMKELGRTPVIDTYNKLIRKLCRWRDHDGVSRLWDEMCSTGAGPDRSAYIVLIHGLFLNGRIEDAFRYYEEMKVKGFDPEPKTDEMMQAWLSCRQVPGNYQSAKLEYNNNDPGHIPRPTKGAFTTLLHDRDYLKPELKNTVRERGYTFW